MNPARLHSYQVLRMFPRISGDGCHSHGLRSGAVALTAVRIRGADGRSPETHTL